MGKYGKGVRKCVLCWEVVPFSEGGSTVQPSNKMSKQTSTLIMYVALDVYDTYFIKDSLLDDVLEGLGGLLSDHWGRSAHVIK